MQKSFIALVAVAAVVAGTALVSSATNAFGFGKGMGSEQHVQAEAQALNMSTDALAQELETKTLPEILNEQNVSQEEFQASMEEQASERMRERGLSEEEIQARLGERQAQIDARQEMFASLMGIDVETLKSALETKTMPELLDEYNVSHVALHDAMQTFHEDNPNPGFGHHGPGKGMGMR